MTRVLIVDDDPEALGHAASLVAGLGYTVVSAAGGEAALATLRADSSFAAVVLDLVMPDLDGMAVLEALARQGFAPPVVVAVTAPSAETIVSILRAGAVDFIDKPATAARLLAALAHARHRAAADAALGAERRRRTATLELADIIAANPAMQRAVAVCRKAARSPLPLLLEGEPGTGREDLARAVHGSGDRAGRPFIVVDCATPAAEEIERLLFGERNIDLPGAFVRARGGTLLLREIGNLPLPLQRAVLRALETGECCPMGGGRPMRLNMRLVATSSRRLLDLARCGAFDAGLYNRLNVLPLYLPPLRDRPEDLAPLIARILIVLSAETGRRIGGISPAALALLAAYDWPGNVRELENTLFRALALAGSAVLEPADFPHLVAALEGRDAARQQMAAMPSAPVHFGGARSGTNPMEGSQDRFLGRTGELIPLAELERELILFALGLYRGRMSSMARALGIGRSTLYRKLRDYGFDDALDRDAA